MMSMREMGSGWARRWLQYDDHQKHAQVPYQTIWSIGFIVVSTALTLESLLEFQSCLREFVIELKVHQILL